MPMMYRVPPGERCCFSLSNISSCSVGTTITRLCVCNEGFDGYQLENYLHWHAFVKLGSATVRVASTECRTGNEDEEDVADRLAHGL